MIILPGFLFFFLFVQFTVTVYTPYVRIPYSSLSSICLSTCLSIYCIAQLIRYIDFLVSVV